MIVKEIDIPIYFGTLVLIITDDYKEVDKKYCTRIDNNLYEAVFFEVKENDKYIVVIKNVQWSIIAHEIVHVVNAIFLNCGIQLDINNDEPQAYLTGWVANEVDIFLKSNHS